MSIRPATLADRDEIWRVHTRAIREIAASAYAPNQIGAWAGFLRPESYTEVIEAGRGFVAEEAEGIVGFGQFNAESGEVEATYVLPEAKGHGIGGLLLREAESRARSAGFGSIHLSASLNSVAFYEHAGFVQEKSAYYSLPSGVPLECIVMRKQLGQAAAQQDAAADAAKRRG